jgi:preprotein translocase subunit SecG
MDFISKAKDIGSSAFGSSSSSGASGSSSSSGSGGGMFSNFFNLSIQKMVLILAVIAFIISVGTVAILLWKSKSSQQWPPEIAKCPDRMALSSDGNSCVDTYGLGVSFATPNATNCDKFNSFKSSKLNSIGSEGYAPWEGILDGKESRASSLKCAI